MKQMTSRERVLATLNHEEPDRIPVDIGSTITTTMVLAGYKRFKNYLDISDSPDILVSRMFQAVKMDERILKLLQVDFRPVFYGGPKGWKDIEGPNDTYVDEWGLKLRRAANGFYYDMIDHPLKNVTIEDLGSYNWPDPLDPGRFEGIEKEARELHENSDYAVVGPGCSVGFFELCWYLRGLEQLFMDMVLNPDFVHALFRKVLDIRKSILSEYLKRTGKYLDVVYSADDLGAQESTLMSPELYREMVKPYQKELFAFIRERTDAKIFYHCCGDVYPLIPDLIEIGVDALNPVQVSARDMDTKRLKEKFGDKITFWGAIDTQHVLPHGTPQEVREEVRRRVKDLAPGGGYVLAAVHAIQPDVPPENILCMCKAARQYGRYPITS